MKQLLTLFLLLAGIGLSAQNTQQQYKFRVYLKDKGAVEYSVSEPEKFLTKQSIERKNRQNVKIDESDFPISPDYFNQIIQAGGKPTSYSKWFKTIVVQLNDSAQIDNILRLPFVDSAKYVWRGSERKPQEAARPRLEFSNCEEDTLKDVFGVSSKQFEMHNARRMALSGFTGKGINIAVIDAGFTNVDVAPQFSNVVGFKNFVPSGEVFSANNHGTAVFSTMAVNLPNKMMGSAPAANYWLLRSEDASSEFPVEEDYWVRAVEYADSMGIDLVNTSLGYTSFDDKNLSYKHADLDGKTSLMTLATDRAYEKGILMVTSAGNEGNKAWQKISPPGDSQYALTVGAAASDSTIAPFSSRGFTADNRVKPDVVSVGHGTFTVGQNGKIRQANGTSFSSPFMAGLVASLWSINPDLNRAEVLDIVKRSAHQYNRPDSVFGYGIPDFGRAMKEVLATLPVSEKSVSEKAFSVTRPNKTTFLVTLVKPAFSLDAYQLNLLDESGNLVSRHEFKEETLNISVPAETRKKNKFVHLVFNTPFEQKTVRVKL